MDKRIIPNNEVSKKYPDLVAFLCSIGIHDFLFVEDRRGIWRFRENLLTGLLLETVKPSLDLNRLSVMSGKNFRMREWVLLYIEMGYSLSGFEEVFENLMDEVLGIVRDPESGEEIRREECLDVRFVDEYADFWKAIVKK